MTSGIKQDHLDAPLSVKTPPHTRRPLARLMVVSGLCAAILPATTAHAAPGESANAVAYRNHVNAICRSYTPGIRAAEAEMQTAQAAGEVHGYAYAVGVLVGITYRQGIRVEKTPVPTDAAARIARPLRLLHSLDIQLRKIVATAIAGDLAGVLAQVAPLEKLAGPLNKAFDAVGLRDCGSNQS
jgi:hypothetical protein